MAAETRSLGNQLQILNNKLTLGQKLSVLAFAATVIAGMAILVHFMNQEEYQTLYSGLNADESATVMERLKGLNVPYKLADSGRLIQVPTERINELRIQLASEGLPQSGKIGFEVFDRTNFGMTEFVEKVNYKRALEGELVRTILSLKEIAQARVHLVLPKESLFEQRSEPAKASVAVNLNAGRKLNEGTVSGIVHLVASAVEGLDPNNVTVVDAGGNLLSARRGNSEEALTATQLELKARTENDFSEKVRSILEPVVGMGKVKANASVVMDFSRSEQTEEKFDPQASVIRSQEKTEDRSEPSEKTAAGVPGTQSNDSNPSPAFIPLAKNVNSSLRQSESTKYEVSRTTRRTLEPAGEIKKISIAVIVDNAVKQEKGADGSVTKTSAPRQAEELTKIRDLVGAAIGIDTNRGDMLTVENIAFDAPWDAEEVVTPTFGDNWGHLIQPILKYGAFLILFVLAYLLLLRPASKKVFQPFDQVALSAAVAELPGQSAPALGLATPKTVKELEAEIAAGPTQIPTGEVRKADILKQRIAELVHRDPEAGAQLVRAWLTEKGK